MGGDTGPATTGTSHLTVRLSVRWWPSVSVLIFTLCLPAGGLSWPGSVGGSAG